MLFKLLLMQKIIRLCFTANILKKFSLTPVCSPNKNKFDINFVFYYKRVALKSASLAKTHTKWAPACECISCPGVVSQRTHKSKRISPRRERLLTRQNCCSQSHSFASVFLELGTRLQPTQRSTKKLAGIFWYFIP